MPSNEIQRLRWQCRRGMLELDYLLEGYLDKQYETAAESERLLFSHLLDQHDLDLQRWLLQEQLPNDQDLALIASIVRKNDNT